MCPSNFEDLYDVKEQWKYIICKFEWPLNIQLLLIYLLPSYILYIISFFYIYFISRYIKSITSKPIKLAYHKMQELLNLETPSTWQEFLVCKSQSIQEEMAVTFENGDGGDLNNIFNNILDEVSVSHLSINDREVAKDKVELFLRIIAEDPRVNVDSCLHELLFVIEIMQIKKIIAMRINNNKLTSNYGVIIPIPRGLPESPIAEKLKDVLIVNGHELLWSFQEIFARYCNQDVDDQYNDGLNQEEMIPIPLYHLKDVTKIHTVYDRLKQFKDSLCPINNNDIPDFESQFATFSQSIEAKIGLELGDALQFDYDFNNNNNNNDENMNNNNTISDFNINTTELNMDIMDIKIDLKNINMDDDNKMNLSTDDHDHFSSSKAIDAYSFGFANIFNNNNNKQNEISDCNDISDVTQTGTGEQSTQNEEEQGEEEEEVKYQQEEHTTIEMEEIGGMEEIESTFNGLFNNMRHEDRDIVQIFEIINVYDELLVEMNEKVQDCYNKYIKKNIEGRLGKSRKLLV